MRVVLGSITAMGRVGIVGGKQSDGDGPGSCSDNSQSPFSDHSQGQYGSAAYDEITSKGIMG
jgi:hypothetical protein